jgi:hypothetical protein
VLRAAGHKIFHKFVNGAQVPAWLAPMTDKQSLLPARAGRIN